jgi:membrane fusion protein, heavy metal efflux system
VQAETSGKQAGLAIPVSSLVRNATNETVLWVHSSAETFVPRRIRSLPLDANRVLIIDGLRAGERVVIQGANALNQVR